MRKTSLVLFCFAFIQISYGQSDKKLIKQSFNNYKQSILEDRGIDAANSISSKTLSYYEDMLSNAIVADSATVNGLPFFDKFTVLIMRHTVAQDQLMAMDAKNFFAYTVENGFFGKESIINSEIKDVKVEGKFAQCEVKLNKTVAPFKFDFYKENGIWKFDLTTIIKTTSGYIVEFIKSTEYSVNSFIMEALIKQNGKTPRTDIWMPIKN